MLNSFIEYKDWILLMLGIIGGIAWSLILFFYLLKPSLEIKCCKLRGNQLQVKIINQSSKRNAVNLKIEVCFLHNSNTYHLNVDKEDFLILPPNDFRIFKMNSLSETAVGYGIDYEELLEGFKTGKYSLRVRIHATHEYSGFGKAFEGKFRYDKKECIEEVSN